MDENGILEIVKFKEIKENLESKISNMCHMIIPVERLVAEFKYDLYGEGMTC